MVDHLVGVASRRGYARVSLETGAGGAFRARLLLLYAGAGFVECGPFGDYPGLGHQRFHDVGDGARPTRLDVHMLCSGRT